MLLVKFLNKVFKTGGFILEDANGISYNVGKIQSREKPLTIKLLDKKLHYQLFIHPHWYFPLGYEKGLIEIKNGSIENVTDLFYKNAKKNSYIGGISNYFEKIYTLWTNITNIATISTAKRQIQKHYDVNNHEAYNYKILNHLLA